MHVITARGCISGVRFDQDQSDDFDAVDTKSTASTIKHVRNEDFKLMHQRRPIKSITVEII